jgi:hypothetical protein
MVLTMNRNGAHNEPEWVLTMGRNTHPSTHVPKWAWTQRASKAEGAIWRINAFLLKKKNETDQDYHLVLQRNGKTLVAEIPNPDCLDDTPEPLKSMIIKARSDFDDWFAEHHSEGPVFHQRVSIWGIGMFDTQGHAEGTASNGIELHPVVKIEFLD